MLSVAPLSLDPQQELTDSPYQLLHLSAFCYGFPGKEPMPSAFLFPLERPIPVHRHASYSAFAGDSWRQAGLARAKLAASAAYLARLVLSLIGFPSQRNHGALFRLFKDCICGYVGDASALGEAALSWCGPLVA